MVTYRHSLNALSKPRDRNDVRAGVRQQDQTANFYSFNAQNGWDSEKAFKLCLGVSNASTSASWVKFGVAVSQLREVCRESCLISALKGPTEEPMYLGSLTAVSAAC